MNYLPSIIVTFIYNKMIKNVSGVVIVVLLILFSVNNAAGSLSKPEIRTDSAWVSSECAILNNMIKPNEANTTYHFEYGTSTCYGFTTDNIDIGAGILYIPVSSEIVGLDPSTSYHYRIVATNNMGTTYGNDQTFTTLVNDVSCRNHWCVTNDPEYGKTYSVEILGSETVGITNITVPPSGGVLNCIFSRDDYIGVDRNVTLRLYGYDSYSGCYCTEYKSKTVSNYVNFDCWVPSGKYIIVGSIDAYPINNYFFSIGVNFYYRVTAQAGDNGRVGSAPMADGYREFRVLPGEDLIVPIYPDAGYYTANVTVDKLPLGVKSSHTFLNVTSKHTIEATFSNVPVYNINASAGNHGGISPSGLTTVNHGSSQAYTIIPDEAYHVSDVLINGSSVGGVTSYTFEDVQSDNTITATFESNAERYRIIACASSGGNISPSGIEDFAYGADQIFAITPNYGNHIVDVLVDGSSVGAVTIYTFANIDADHTIMAIFDVVEYEKLSDSFQISSYTGDWQGDPSVAGLSNSGFVVVWGAHSQDDDGSLGVRGQLCDAAGGKNGGEFQVNTWTVGDQDEPAVAGLRDGGFVVTWTSSYGQDGDGSGIFGQFFNAAGGKNGGEFQVNTWTVDDQNQPAVFTLSGGNFVVTWSSYGQGSSGYDIYGQMFDSSGNRVGNEFKVSPDIDDWQRLSSLSGLSNGGFIVTWTSSYGQDGDGSGIFGQIFDNSGSKVGNEFQVNTYVSDHQSSPAVSGLASGFVVAWQSNYQDGSGYGIYGQMFDNLGNKIGSEFQINTFTSGSQCDPSVTVLSGDCFVVTWMSYDGEIGIYGQFFCGPGGKIGGEFLMKACEASLPSLSHLFENGFVSVWGYAKRIYGQLWTETYKLIANAGNHGSISPSGIVKALRGSEQIFVITPNDGYHIVDTFVDGVSIGATSTYTFTNISSNHTISADFTNFAPTADAGTDQTVDEGASVTLDGSGSSDSDDGIATYLWMQTGGKQATLSNPGIAKPTFTAPDVTPAGETLVFQLTVTDNGGLQDTDTVSITVGGDNDPPTADAGSDQTVDEGTIVTLDASGSSDPDDGIASYLWEQIGVDTVTLSDTSAIQPTFTTPDVGVEGGTVTFQLTVTDTGGLQDTDTCVVTVSWVNMEPSADAGPDQTVDEGTTVTLDGSDSSDIDDGIASYVWTQTDGPFVSLSDVSLAKPTFTAPDVGLEGESLTFELLITDNGGLQNTDACTVNIIDLNIPPIADAGPDQTVDEDTTVTLDGSGSSDPDDNIASYLWEQTDGTSVTLSDTNAEQPTFTAPAVGPDGESLTFQLTVTDNDGFFSTDTCTVSITNIVSPGDIDDSGEINLADAILALQICTGITPSQAVYKSADVNGDGRIGIEEVIYILQKVSGLRE
ncbi:MAG: PKD domain-containing protein [Thermodesulfobacteriota bacterium]|nr:PKD domain-containing protein [Thermodesulfobacteriota bacterium]